MLGIGWIRILLPRRHWIVIERHRFLGPLVIGAYPTKWRALRAAGRLYRQYAPIPGALTRMRWDVVRAERRPRPTPSADLGHPLTPTEKLSRD